jgi:DNA-binding MarR family transcriptional regulator
MATTTLEYSLTMLGKKRVDVSDIAGIKGQVLAYLYENAGCSASDIASHVHEREGKVQEILDRLLESDLVTYQKKH